jgi:hypothetical protein
MRRVTGKKRGYSKTLADTAAYLLNTAEEIRKRADAACLDTAVRDEIAEGLAYIVRAGNDCRACNLNLETDQWLSFIDRATEDWFRARGYAEWFCFGAASGFNTSRPRTLDDRCFNVFPMRKKRKGARSRAHLKAAHKKKKPESPVNKIA